MIHKFKHLQKIAITALSSFFLFSILRLILISPILGSYFSYFSLSGIIMPLLGILGMPYVIISLIALKSTSLFSYQLLFTKITAYHIPTLCAAYYWSSKSKLISFLAPVLCIIAFLIHPIGLQAAPYTLYWLIPLFLSFNKKPSYITHALISTFVAHAIGSVIWLYTKPMNASDWISLIPVVAIERFCFAGCMILVYYAAHNAYNALSKIKTSQRKTKGLI